MPRANKRRPKRRALRRDANDEDLFQLVSGGRYFEPLLPDDVLAELWELWRDELMAAWLGTGPWPALLIECWPSVKANAKPGTRPYAWWRFDSPEPRNDAETQAEQLARLGLLSQSERAAVVSHAQT